MPSQNSDPIIRRAICWTISAFFLAMAIQDNDGRYSLAGMLCLSVAIFAALAGVFSPALPGWVPVTQRSLNGLLGICATLFAPFWMQFGAPFTLLGYFTSLGFCAVIAIILVRLASFALLRRALFAILLIFYLMVGMTTIIKVRSQELSPRYSPFHVRNDVQIFAQEAARVLSQGKNPYSLRMPNVMVAGTSSGRGSNQAKKFVDMPFYSPGTTGPDGKLSFGYPYLPLSALWSLPAYWMGDFRYSHLLALLGAAVLLAYARPSVTSKLAATLFLLFPPTLFVLIMSWIEPVAIFFLAATVFCYFRAPKWLFVALGCLFASKQYTVFFLPLLPLLVPEKETRSPLLWKSLGVAALLTLPMALWDVAGFYRSVVEIQFKQPFREDSLSYLVTVFQTAGLKLSPLCGFAALLGALWLGARKAPATVAGWCGAAAVAYLGFFALNKQAFANYYFWPFSLLVAAVAIALPPQQTPVANGLENEA